MTDAPTSPRAPDAPWSLAERIALATKMAKGDFSVVDIAAAARVSLETAAAIAQRERPDFSDFSRLRRTSREIAE